MHICPKQIGNHAYFPSKSINFPKMYKNLRFKFTIQTPHALSLLKGFVSNFDSIDKDLVNIISKPYLLTTRLSCSDFPFSYGIKSFGVY